MNALPGWRLLARAGISVAVCDALEAVPGLGHGFSARDAGDLGGADDLDEALAVGRRRFCDAVGFPKDRQPVVLRQVHGDTVLRAARVARGAAPEADGLVMHRDDLPWISCVRWADCCPVLLADAAGRAAAAVHAGWRGTALGIAGKAVGALRELGIEPAGLRAALGPAIGGCCYQVGSDVARQVGEASGGLDEGLADPDGEHFRLDLREANRRQLVRAGIPAAEVHIAPWCTRCARDLFFSYRGDGGPTGRQIACIGWQAAESDELP